MKFDYLVSLSLNTDGEAQVGPNPQAPLPPADQEAPPADQEAPPPPPQENRADASGEEEGQRPPPSGSSADVPPSHNQLLDQAPGQQGGGNQGPGNDVRRNRPRDVSTPLGQAGLNVMPLRFPVSSALANDNPTTSSPHPVSSGPWVCPIFNQTKRRSEQDGQDADDSSKKRRVVTRQAGTDSSDNKGNESGSNDDDDKTPPPSPSGTDSASTSGTGGSGGDGKPGSFKISNHLMTSTPPAHEIDRAIKNYGIYEIDDLTIHHETFGSVRFIGSHDFQLLGKEIDMNDFIEFRHGGIELKEPLLQLSWPIKIRLVNVTREDFAKELDKETIEDFELEAFLGMVSSAMGASYSRYDPVKKEWEIVRLAGGEPFKYVVGRH